MNFLHKNEIDTHHIKVVSDNESLVKKVCLAAY